MIGGRQVDFVGLSFHRIQVLNRQPITSGLLYRVRYIGHSSVGENRHGPIGTDGKVSDLCFRLGLHRVNINAPKFVVYICIFLTYNAPNRLCPFAANLSPKCTS